MAQDTAIWLWQILCSAPSEIGLWLRSLAGGAPVVLGSVLGAVLGFGTLVAGALLNARLNRRRDGELRKVEVEALGRALAAEVGMQLRAVVDVVFNILEFSKHQNPWRRMSEVELGAVRLPIPVVYNANLAKIGLLSNGANDCLVRFHYSAYAFSVVCSLFCIEAQNPGAAGHAALHRAAKRCYSDGLKCWRRLNEDLHIGDVELEEELVRRGKVIDNWSSEAEKILASLNSTS